MAGFIGKELHALDDKGRLMIPVRFRRDLFSGNSASAIYLYLMKAPDGSLELYEPEVWQHMKEALAGLSDFNPDERLLKTLIYESLDIVAVDRQGRISLSREFLEHAGITKDVVIIGADSKMVIWEPGRLALLLREHAAGFSSLAGKYF
ncbi:MAG: division/cell wall cluster transcriptional repressor MraZ [Chlorobi bacterium]|nr:division/cell wall cluster transcriptional repressor MraZ [Chlorobiota bacterium]